MEVLKLNLDNFEEETATGLVLVDFWADWCAPCRNQSKVLDEIAKMEGINFKLCKLNIDDFPEIASRYEVHSIPTMIIFKKGDICEQLVGFKGKESLLETLGRYSS